MSKFLIIRKLYDNSTASISRGEKFLMVGTTKTDLFYISRKTVWVSCKGVLRSVSGSYKCCSKSSSLLSSGHSVLEDGAEDSEDRRTRSETLNISIISVSSSSLLEMIKRYNADNQLGSSSPNWPTEEQRDLFLIYNSIKRINYQWNKFQIAKLDQSRTEVSYRDALKVYLTL